MLLSLLLLLFPADAFPRVTCAGGPSGSGVVVGVRDGFGYVLTAAHVLPFDGLEVRGRTGAGMWFAKSPEVVRRWPEPDLALVRFPLDKIAIPVWPVPLAAAGDRPKAFPVPVRAVGLNPDDTAAAWDDTLRAKRFVRKSASGIAFFWETERPPTPGRSGGPLLDARGRVIGICSATQDGRGYYTHHDEILAALTRDGFGWLVRK